MADLKVNIGADISGLEKGLKQSEASLKNFGQQVNRSVPQATQAFTNLSRVVSDAPFGFIGIQNNLEPLLQSFQQLKSQTGSTGGALKALASSLAGAGGVMFAFSAVSSIITVLIQKYGSLGAAFNEFASASDRASVAQRALNRELVAGVASQQGEVSSLKALVTILNDSNASQLQRTNAYKELKKEYPGVIQGLTEENALTEEGGRLIAARSVQLIKYIQLKAREAALIKLGEEAAKKQLEAAKNGIETLQSQGSLLSNLINNIAGAGNTSLGLIRRINSASSEFQDAGKDADLFAQGLENVKRELATFDPKLTGLEKVVPKTLKKVDVKIPEVRIIPDRVQLDTSQLEADSEAIRNFRQNNGFEIPVNISVPKSAFDELRKFGESEYWTLISGNTQKIINQFDQFLTPVINTAFEALGNGANIFKAIGQSLKALVVQLGITIAKSLILAAVLNSIFPGGTMLGGKEVQGFGGIFKGLIGGMLGGNVAAPNFSSVQGGGVAVTVGGQFNVRGTDLVAVVNQGNQRIGRVG